MEYVLVSFTLFFLYVIMVLSSALSAISAKQPIKKRAGITFVRLCLFLILFSVPVFFLLEFRESKIRWFTYTEAMLLGAPGLTAFLALVFFAQRVLAKRFNVTPGIGAGENIFVAALSIAMISGYFLNFMFIYLLAPAIYSLYLIGGKLLAKKKSQPA